ncbi:MAG: PPOX class F420-dependent enzyme [Actinomycetia bacterium]|nr:PPOX class F420-dependent enzyme [Actinomycetes bacterium]
MTVFDPASLPDEVLTFMSEPHLATLSIPRVDGAPHVTPVGFTWDARAGLARVITWSSSKKYRLVEQQPTAVTLCQVDGARWLTLEGQALATTNPTRCAQGTDRYAERYRPPAIKPDRAVIEIAVSRIMGRARP